MTDPSQPITLQDLLEHAAWVQRLALRLVRDQAIADDIVQRTWLAATRRLPRHRSRVKGWLRRVVRNLAYEEHRARMSREARERAVARPEALDLSAADLLQRAEATELLAGAVQTLPEPYRTAVLRRYYQGQSVRQTAENAGIPLETARTHLKRGVAMLRANLKERDGKDWAWALVPLLPRHVGGPLTAPAVPHTGRPTRSAPRFIAAGLLVTAAAVAVVVSLTPAGETASTRTAEPGAAKPASRAATAARSPRPEASPDAVTPPPATRPAEATAASPNAAPAPTARVSMALQRDGDVPAGPIPVVAAPRGVGSTNARAWSRKFEAEGSVASLDLPVESPEHKRIRSWDVRVDRPDLVPATALVTMPEQVTGAIECRLDVHLAGILTGTLGLPSPPAVCQPFAAVLAEGEVPGPPLDTSDIGADGSFRLRLLPDRPSRIVVAVRGCRPVVIDATVPRGATRTAGPIPLDPGGHIAGTVVGPDGSGLSRVPVTVRSTAIGATSLVGVHDVTVDGKEADWGTLKTLTDAGGRFRFDGLRPGRHRVSASVPGLTTDRSAALTRDVGPDADDVHIVMDGGIIVVTAMSDGVPRPGVVFSVLGPTGGSGAKTGADGRARIVGQPGAKYTITCLTEDKSVHQIEGTAPEVGRVTPLVLDLGPKPVPAKVALIVRGAPGVRRAGIHTFGVDGNDKYSEVVLDLDATASQPGESRFQLDLPPGPVKLAVRPGGGWGDSSLYLEQSVDIDPQAGREVAAEVPLVAGGRLRAGARDRDGKFVGANCTLRSADGQIVHVNCPRDEPGGLLRLNDVLSPHGAEILSPALAPGAYVLHVEAPGYVANERRVEVRAGEISDLVLDLDRR